jgi:maltose/moltooligosaccharide transporter
MGAFGFVVTFDSILFGKVGKSTALKWFIWMPFRGAASLLFFPVIQNQYFFCCNYGYGIAWASMMGIPYLMVVANIPKERYGVYIIII